MSEIYISIITPCYNGEDFIETAIKSVIAQKAEFIEHIVVDDGSTDKTEDICQAYIGENFNYIKITNSGAGHARNVGISQAKGKWIAFLDSDDVLLCNAFTIDFLKKLKIYEKEGNDIIWTPRYTTSFDLRSEVAVTKADREVKNHMSPLEFWTCLYRTNYLRENEIRFYEYRNQDIESAFRYMTASNTEKIIVDNNMGFYLQRVNLKSNTHTWNIHNLCNVKMKVFWDLYKNTSHYDDREYLYFTIVKLYVMSCIVNKKDIRPGDIDTIKENKKIFRDISDAINNRHKKSLILKETIKQLREMYRNKKRSTVSVHDTDQNLTSMITYEDIKKRLDEISRDVRA